MNLRLIVSAALVAIGCLAIVSALAGDALGFIRDYLGYAVVVILGLGALIEFREHRQERRETNAEQPKATGIQLIRRDEVTYDEPATLHYPEGDAR